MNRFGELVWAILALFEVADLFVFILSFRFLLRGSKKDETGSGRLRLCCHWQGRFFCALASMRIDIDPTET